MIKALQQHWPEYLMEAFELAIFMISAGVFTILVYHPGSPVAQVISSEFIRRALSGLAMGLTLIGLVYSPWGKRSGAHMNPAFTLTSLRKVPLKLDGDDLEFRSEFSFEGPKGAPKAHLALAVWVTVSDSLEPLQATGGWLAR